MSLRIKQNLATSSSVALNPLYLVGLVLINLKVKKFSLAFFDGNPDTEKGRIVMEDTQESVKISEMGIEINTLTKSYLKVKQLNFGEMISVFIPIRKGSKVKNKNFKKLPNFKNGLTEIKVKQLKKFRLFSKKLKQEFEYVVSTDSEKILKILKNYPWIKAYKRKKSLSTDNSLQKLIKHVPQICKGDYILWTRY